MAIIDLATQYGLIGYPLGHSFSKQYFEEKFVKENLHHCIFNLFPLVNVNEFDQIIDTYQYLKGMAVTIPHKQNIIPLLHTISEEAKTIGAVNCIKIKNGYTIGYNTDVVGFEQSLVPLLLPHHTSALVLGTGGASKAVQYVLKKLGINFTLVSRNKNMQSGIINYQDISTIMLQKNTLIINTTPLGMVPSVHTYPHLDYSQLTKKHLCYDLVYKPQTTLFLQKCAAHGAVVKNGFEMLILQAEENWKIWNS